MESLCGKLRANNKLEEWCFMQNKWTRLTKQGDIKSSIKIKIKKICY